MTSNTPHVPQNSDSDTSGETRTSTPTPSFTDELRDIIFKCAGGISDMGEVELQMILTALDNVVQGAAPNRLNGTSSYQEGVSDTLKAIREAIGAKA